MMVYVESAGDKLKARRISAGHSQEDVALAVGVSPGAVSQYERGTTAPRRAVAAKLDQFLGAGGDLLHAFGYAMPAPPAVSQLDVALREMEERLRSEIDAVDARLRGLEESLRVQLESMVAPLEALADRLERERRES